MKLLKMPLPDNFGEGFCLSLILNNIIVVSKIIFIFFFLPKLGYYFPDKDKCQIQH